MKICKGEILQLHLYDCVCMSLCSSYSLTCTPTICVFIPQSIDAKCWYAELSEHFDRWLLCWGAKIVFLIHRRMSDARGGFPQVDTTLYRLVVTLFFLESLLSELTDLGYTQSEIFDLIRHLQTRVCTSTPAAPAVEACVLQTVVPHQSCRCVLHQVRRTMTIRMHPDLVLRQPHVHSQRTTPPLPHLPLSREQHPRVIRAVPNLSQVSDFETGPCPLSLTWLSLKHFFYTTQCHLSLGPRWVHKVRACRLMEHTARCICLHTPQYICIICIPIYPWTLTNNSTFSIPWALVCPKPLVVGDSGCHMEGSTKSTLTAIQKPKGQRSSAQDRMPKDLMIKTGAPDLPLNPSDALDGCRLPDGPTKLSVGSKNISIRSSVCCLQGLIGLTIRRCQVILKILVTSFVFLQYPQVNVWTFGLYGK